MKLSQRIYKNTCAVSVLSPVEEVCLKLQLLTMGVCLCWCPLTKATVGFLKRLALRTGDTVKGKKTLLPLGRLQDLKTLLYNSDTKVV